MFNIYEILGILFIHWFADFVLQTDKQAKGKSKEWGSLLDHTATYSSVWMIIGLIYFFIIPSSLLFVNVLYFTGITFICHTITDYYTSRVNSQLYSQNRIHDFFVSIGFDQWLHYVQLFLTYYLLIK